MQRHLVAVEWFYANDPEARGSLTTPAGAAALIVEIAALDRWNPLVINTSGLARAARAITYDTYYRSEIVSDAWRAMKVGEPLPRGPLVTQLEAAIELLRATDLTRLHPLNLELPA